MARPTLYVERESRVVHLNADHVRSFDLDAISQFERDISTALVIVRGWMNTFAPINRIPLDILCLIPTHISSQKDRFRVSFVCRHWRRVFLQHAALWTQLILRNRKDYVATLLKRAKGSALDVIAVRGASLGTVTLLSPHTRQIRHLWFPYNDWTDILTFPGVNSGSLPRLRTLNIYLAEPDSPSGVLTPLPSPPLFSGAIDLEEFTFNSEFTRLLNCFTFPNLTTFKLTASPISSFSTSDFLGFLQASPTLRTVKVEIFGGSIPGEITQDMAVVLPNVETFSLQGKVDGWHVCHLATHISCPRAKHISLEQEVCNRDTADVEIFPDPASWGAIVRQYSTSPVEQVTLVIQDDPFAAYSLIFRSSDTAVIKLGFEVESDLTWVGMDLDIFSQACSTIRAHPLLSHLKSLYIQDWSRTFGFDCALPMVGVVGELFRCLGPLDELAFNGCVLGIFLAPFFDLPVSRSFARVFPHVKKLTISEGRAVDNQLCMDVIVELAKFQYEQEKPFEHVAVSARDIPVGTAERLREWVGAADCRQI
jgi:hypothetical protein